MAIPIVQKTRELLSTKVSTLEEETSKGVYGSCKVKPRHGFEGPYACMAEAEHRLKSKKPAVTAIGSSGTGKTKLVNTLRKQSLLSEAVYTRTILQEDEKTELAEEEVVAPDLQDPLTERQLPSLDFLWLRQWERFNIVKGVLSMRFAME